MSRVKRRRSRGKCGVMSRSVMQDRKHEAPREIESAGTVELEGAEVPRRAGSHRWPVGVSSRIGRRPSRGKCADRDRMNSG